MKKLGILRNLNPQGCSFQRKFCLQIIATERTSFGSFTKMKNMLKNGRHFLRFNREKRGKIGK